jgi:hypothetical protein
MGVGGQRHAPAALSPGKTRYPLYRRLGGPQGRSVQVRKISSPPGFDSQTVQPVASRSLSSVQVIKLWNDAMPELHKLRMSLIIQEFKFSPLGIPDPWRWEYYVRSKRRAPLNQRHGIVSRKKWVHYKSAQTSNPITPRRQVTQMWQSCQCYGKYRIWQISQAEVTAYEILLLKCRVRITLGFTGEGKVLSVFHVTVTGATVIQ